MGTQGSASVGPAYMSSLPVSFQEMADVTLVVEGVDLPAHKAILAANSQVFADLFTSQALAAPSKSDIPLAGESLQDVMTTLTYLYRNCVFSTTAQPIDCPEDARALIRFGHKFGMQGILNALQLYLVSQVQQADPQSGDYILMKTNEDVASWTATAEKYDLRELLAHCEDFMIRDHDDKLWHDKALVGDGVSRASLLRILRGLQWSRTQMLNHINQEINKRNAPDSAKRDYDVGITRLLEWHKSAEA